MTSHDFFSPRSQKVRTAPLNNPEDVTPMPDPSPAHFCLRKLMERLQLTEVTTFAEAVGLSRKSCYRYFVSGVPMHIADRLAIRCGLHPLEVWPDFHDDVDWDEAA